MFCSACGKKNTDDATFCTNCGNKVTSSTTAQLSSPIATPAYVSADLKESWTVTAMSVVGFVLGLIGMMGSFIPSLGSLAFYIGIPAALISAIALGIAYSANAKKTFAVVAVTISLIGLAISGWQYFPIVSVVNKAKAEIDQWLEPGAGVQPNNQTNDADRQPELTSLESERLGRERLITLLNKSKTSTKQIADFEFNWKDPSFRNMHLTVRLTDANLEVDRQELGIAGGGTTFPTSIFWFGDINNITTTYDDIMKMYALSFNYRNQYTNNQFSGVQTWYSQDEGYIKDAAEKISSARSNWLNSNQEIVQKGLI